jgi:V8-like Glu-specific endopeptidase
MRERWMIAGLVSIVALIWVGGPAAAADWALKASYATRAEAATFRSPPLGHSDGEQANADQTGHEEDSCPNALIRRSHATSNASAKRSEDIPADGQSLNVSLSVSVTAQGGGYRTCDVCALTCVGLHPHDTDAIASASSTAQMTVAFNGDKPRSATLMVNQIATGTAALEVYVEDQDGRLLGRLEHGSKSFPIRADPGHKLTIHATLAASASDRGTCCSTSRIGAATVSVSVTAATVELSNVSPPSDERVPRVIGGSLEQGYPGVGYILRDGAIWCTGSAVGSKTVLTAAHCVDGQDPTHLTFILSLTDKDRPKDDIYHGTGADFPKDPAKGPAYDRLIWADDIGLLYVDRSIMDPSDPHRTTPIARLGLYAGTPTLAQIHDTTNLLFIGYGYSDALTGAVAPPNGTKRSVSMPVADYSRKTFKNQTIGQNTCAGDSGGPALMTTSPAPVIIGVVSTGDTTCVHYGINTRLDAYASWLSGRIQ